MLNTETRSFVESYGDPFEVHFDTADETYVFVFRERKPIPTRWGLIFGDFIGNARSSLDHLVWQLVLANGAVPGRHNAFPVYETRPAWNANVENRPARRGAGPLEGIAATAWAKIKALQPYHAGNQSQAHFTWLAGLNTMWNIDKHQVVHPSIAYVAGVVPQVTVSPTQYFLLGSVLYGQQALVDGAEVARVQILQVTTPGDREVHVDFTCPLSVAFGEEGRGLASMGFLDHIMKQLHASVATFEDEFS
ncbi:MAG: hypothetical protein ACLP62_10155 [Acidimicrobiales bacterium]